MYIFVNRKQSVMENFVAAVIVMMSLSIAIFQIIRNHKYKELAERKHKLLSILLCLEAALVVFDLSVGGDDIGLRLVSDLLLVLIPLSLISSSLWTTSASLNVVRVAAVVMSLLGMYYLLCAVSLAELIPTEIYRVVIIILVTLLVLLFMLGIWFRVREIRAVMQSGNVWSSISFVVDAVYVVLVLLEVAVLLSLVDEIPILSCVTVILLCGTVASYGMRIACDSLFIFMRSHERTIIESLKISPVEAVALGPDDIYKDIYERVVEYFENEKPYLNGDLTINDIVSVVYTNKLYISRAISQHTGRNFCQFVNYYRVMYSVECFRNNPELKVTELWSMCGFNTIVSYNMAFKLFMGENPSDWCRKEKVRIFRRPK